MSSMKLYVGNLPYSTSEPDLKELFQPFGEVESVKVITDRYSGQSKGFGFVEMADRNEGEEAISALNESNLDGRKIRVNEARPRPERDRGDRGDRGGYGGGEGRRRY